MPGWSLWLVPSEGTSAKNRIADIIDSTMPKLFPHLTSLETFSPHVTLTSNINVSEEMRAAPQKWLDALPLAVPEKVNVHFETVQSESKFFKKLFIRCEKEMGLLDLCRQVRMYAVESGDGTAADKFVKEDYDPHCSLMYSEASVTSQMLTDVRTTLLDKGIILSEHQQQEQYQQHHQHQVYPTATTTETETRSTAKQAVDTAVSASVGQQQRHQDGHEQAKVVRGWAGGVIWLVPTDLQIGEWKAVATRVVG